jgi:hypothetical protein
MWSAIGLSASGKVPIASVVGVPAREQGQEVTVVAVAAVGVVKPWVRSCQVERVVLWSELERVVVPVVESEIAAVGGGKGMGNCTSVAGLLPKPVAAGNTGVAVIVAVVTRVGG